MVGRVRQAGCQGARIALRQERVLLRLEPEPIPRNEGVAAYFEALLRWSSPTVLFTDVRTTHAAADLINVAGTASFVVDGNVEPLQVKITWVIVREGGEWKIVSHHVSSKTPLI